jgi:predicted small lipoprotein YifL
MPGRSTLRSVTLAVVLLAFPACAAKRPVLYPNAAYRASGATRAELDVDECVAFAKEHGHATDPAARAGTDAAGGAAVGAATGAAVGAVLGSAGRGAAAGAAGGGTRSLMHGLFRWRDPSPIQRRFVQECLRERGYQVIGWE